MRSAGLESKVQCHHKCTLSSFQPDSIRLQELEAGDVVPMQPGVACPLQPDSTQLVGVEERDAMRLQLQLARNVPSSLITFRLQG